MNAEPLTSGPVLDIVRRFDKSGTVRVLELRRFREAVPGLEFQGLYLEVLKDRSTAECDGTKYSASAQSHKSSLLVRAGMIATVPATPSTLEDYAGRNYGNGIDLPGRSQDRGKRTVTVLVFV